MRENGQRYWGQRLWPRGNFCATVGAVNEEMIQRYIENQSNEEEEFQVWDAEKHEKCMAYSSNCRSP